VLYAHYPSLSTHSDCNEWGFAQLGLLEYLFKILHTLLITSDSTVNDLLDHALRTEEDMLAMKAESVEDMQLFAQGHTICL
jgi:hypothetical protein